MGNEMDIVLELNELSKLEGAWYANVGRKTGERCCKAMREASTEIVDLRLEKSNFERDLMVAKESRDFWLEAADDQNNKVCELEKELTDLRADLEKSTTATPTRSDLMLENSRLNDEVEALKADKQAHELIVAPVHIDKWCEELGDVLWWKFPIVEPPYCGQPIDCDWPDCHTHFTLLFCPTPPKESDE